MDFATLLETLMDFIYSNLVVPINNMLNSYGSVTTDLQSVDIKIGFGEITWFSVSLNELFVIIIGLMVSITALVLTWKFLKMLSNFVRRMFGGIRK